MRTRTHDLLSDHFGVAVTPDTLEDLRVWEDCSHDPFYEASLVAPVFVTEDTPARLSHWLDSDTVQA